MSATRFYAWLAALMVLAFALRVPYGLAVAEVPFGDALIYHQTANTIAHGSPFYIESLDKATALHPPLFPLLLGLFSLAGPDSADAHQLVGIFMAALAVGAIGLVARRIAGPGAGLAAAAVGAVCLPMFQNDTILHSESLYGLLVALTLLAALRALERPSPRRALVLGGVVALATLTRAEAILLLPLLGLPILLRAPGRRLVMSACAVLAALVVLAPWTVRNWLEFDTFVPVSTNGGSVLEGANCDNTYPGGGGWVGSWSLVCIQDVGTVSVVKVLVTERLDYAFRRPERDLPAGVLARIRSRDGLVDEVEEAAIRRRTGIDYIRAHTRKLPLVLGARLLRTWGLFQPGQELRALPTLPGPPRWLQWVTYGAYFCLLALSALGAWTLRRRVDVLLVLAAPIVLVNVVTLLAYGYMRFRHAADVSLVVLAGVALARVAAPWLSRKPSNGPSGRQLLAASRGS